MAALDYVALRAQLPRARLLFVAHREEILTRSRDTFRVALPLMGPAAPANNRSYHPASVTQVAPVPQRAPA